MINELGEKLAVGSECMKKIGWIPTKGQEKLLREAKKRLSLIAKNAKQKVEEEGKREEYNYLLKDSGISAEIGDMILFTKYLKSYKRIFDYPQHYHPSSGKVTLPYCFIETIGKVSKETLNNPNIYYYLEGETAINHKKNPITISSFKKKVDEQDWVIVADEKEKQAIMDKYEVFE